MGALLVKRSPGKRKSERFRRAVRRSPVLAKLRGNPILQPLPANGWEAGQTFNAAVILMDRKVHFLYRAMGGDGISRLGYAVSRDGFELEERCPYPVYQHEAFREV